MLVLVSVDPLGREWAAAVMAAGPFVTHPADQHV